MRYRHRSVPDSGKELRAWVYNVSRLVSKDPAEYGLTEDDAVVLKTEADRFLEAAFLAERPGTRTRVTVRERNDARTRMLKVFRQYAAIIKANPEVDPWSKVGLQLAMPDRRSSPTPPPHHPPVLFIRGGAPLEHTLIYRDHEHGQRRGKPRGVTHLIMLRAIGDRPIRDPARARYLGASTRWPIRIPYVPSDAGRVASYFGAWLMTSGAQTRWSESVSFMIAGAEPGERTTFAA